MPAHNEHIGEWNWLLRISAEAAKSHASTQSNRSRRCWGLWWYSVSSWVVIAAARTIERARVNASMQLRVCMLSRFTPIFLSPIHDTV
jgi:hypothetical protein